MEELNLNFMSFSEAMQNLLEGKKIRRYEWDTGDFLMFDNTQYCFVNYFIEDSEYESDFTMAFLGADDFLACDWEVLCN